jgi:hypothetical protein
MLWAKLYKQPLYVSDTVTQSSLRNRKDSFAQKVFDCLSAEIKDILAEFALQVPYLLLFPFSASFIVLSWRYCASGEHYERRKTRISSGPACRRRRFCVWAHPAAECPGWSASLPQVFGHLQVGAA